MTPESIAWLRDRGYCLDPGLRPRPSIFRTGGHGQAKNLHMHCERAEQGQKRLERWSEEFGTNGPSGMA